MLWLVRWLLWKGGVSDDVLSLSGWREVRVVIEVEGKRGVLCCKLRRVNEAAAVIVVE